MLPHPVRQLVVVAAAGQVEVVARSLRRAFGHLAAARASPLHSHKHSHLYRSRGRLMPANPQSAGVPALGRHEAAGCHVATHGQGAAVATSCTYIYMYM